MRPPDWRARERLARQMRRLVPMRAVQAQAVCPSGTLVLALMRLGVCVREQAERCDLQAEALRATVVQSSGRYTHRLGAPDPMSEQETARLVALIGVVVVDSEGRAEAEAHAWLAGGVGVSAAYRTPWALLQGVWGGCNGRD